MTTATTSALTASAYSQLTITDLTDNVGGGNLIIHSTATISKDNSGNNLCEEIFNINNGGIIFSSTSNSITISGYFEDNKSSSFSTILSFPETETSMSLGSYTYCFRNEEETKNLLYLKVKNNSNEQKYVTYNLTSSVEPNIDYVFSLDYAFFKNINNGLTSYQINLNHIKLEQGNLKTSWGLCDQDISSLIKMDSSSYTDGKYEDNNTEFNTKIEALGVALGFKTIPEAELEKYKGMLGVVETIEEDQKTVTITPKNGSTQTITGTSTSEDGTITVTSDDGIVVTISKDQKTITITKDNNTQIITGTSSTSEDGTITVTSDDGTIVAIKDKKTYALATNFIQTNMLATDAIKSNKFKNSFDEEGFCETGTFLDFNSGNFYSPNFMITNNEAKFKGELMAPTGIIGGFSLDENKLSCGSNSNYVAIAGNNTSTYAFWAGHETDSEAPFSIKYDGTMKANNATVSGNITANTGSIGCLKVESNKLFTDLLEITSDSFKLKDSSTDYLIFSKNNEIFSLDLQNISKLQLANGIEISENKLSFTGDSGINISSGNICIGTTTSTATSDTNYLTVNSSGLQMYNVPSKKTSEEEESKIVNINSKGFSFTPTGTDAYSSSNTYFQMGSNLIYDSDLGLLFGKNLTKVIEDIIKNKKETGTTYANINNDKSINFLIEEKGLFFFTESKIQEPIAYFANDNLYVNKTQVLSQQRISGFQWFVRDGSDYLGDKQHNLGLKWIG